MTLGKQRDTDESIAREPNLISDLTRQEIIKAAGD